VPEEPEAFAKYCMMNGKDFVDAIAMVPTWVVDVHGNKVGSRSDPWRITDYIREFYKAKSPIAIRNRLSKPLREEMMTQKPEIKRSASDWRLTMSLRRRE
jgi:hypothetical protein